MIFAATDTATSFWADASARAMLVAIAVVAIFILWLVLRLAVRGLSKGIERGVEASERQRRKAAKRGIHLPMMTEEIETHDVRLELERRRQRAKTIRAVLNSFINVAAVLIGLMTVLTIVGVPVGPLLASAGVASVALGFGAQSLVKDLISGLFMLLEDQYGVGDIINTGEASGVVEEVGLRSVRLRSIDGTVWYVPNGNIMRIGNMTQLWSRALIEVRLAYDTDLEAARAAMLESVERARQNPEINDAILGEPEVPGIESFDYYGMSVRLLIQVRPVSQWNVMRAVRNEMRTVFEERGIQIAVPDGTVRLDADRPVPKSKDKPVAPAKGATKK